MQKTDPLIRTKLNLPFIRPDLVARPHLKEKIIQGLRCPLILVTAPAGFGKTTTLISSFSDCGIPVAWLSLDQNDNQTGRFLTYLVAALQTIDQSIAMDAVQLMSGLKPAMPEAVITSLINDIDTSGREIALVLDDYHLINSQSIHDNVTFLLEHHPKNFHLVIASRSDPPLPLSRLRARCHIVELRAADLRFTELEAAQFLNDIMNLHLDSRSISALEKRTEGWIAGLQMAALSMRDRQDIQSFIEGFSGTNRYILDYLLEEVLATQKPEIQNFLMRTSILERLSAPLCDAILASDDRLPSGEIGEISFPDSSDSYQSASILKNLENENLFVVSLDDHRLWFRYHHLFADLLRSRLQQSFPEMVPVLHRRASDWFKENGLIPEAIQHLFAANQASMAADLIEQYGPAWLAEGDPSVFRMADNLPPELIITRPRLGIYQAWLLIIQARIAKAVPLLRDITRHLEASDTHMDQLWIKTIIQSALAFLSPVANSPDENPLPEFHQLEKIPAEEPIMRNAADYLYGMALARRGEMDRAVEVSKRCIQREENLQGKSINIPTLVPFLSRVYLMQGRLNDTASLCREYLAPIDEKGIRFVYTAGSIKIDLGEVMYERNCLAEAEQSIRDGLRENEPWQNIMTDGFGLSALSRVLLSKGDYSGAEQAIERLEKRLSENAKPREFDEDFLTLKVRCQLASGDLQTASEWADQVTRGEDYQIHQGLYQLTMAHIRLAQGKYKEVEKLLDRFTPPPGAGSYISRLIKTKFLLAIALAGQDYLQEAFRATDHCLSLAEPEGYIQVFLDLGILARDLLAAYLRSEAPEHAFYAQRVLDAFQPKGSSTSPVTQQGGLVEALSEREIEVLQLIASGRTNQEITHELFIARGTVKAHTANIFRKLDVSNRTEAVARARQLGILS